MFKEIFLREVEENPGAVDILEPLLKHYHPYRPIRFSESSQHVASTGPKRDNTSEIGGTRETAGVSGDPNPSYIGVSQFSPSWSDRPVERQINPCGVRIRTPWHERSNCILHNIAYRKTLHAMYLPIQYTYCKHEFSLLNFFSLVSSFN